MLVPVQRVLKPAIIAVLNLGRTERSEALSRGAPVALPLEGLLKPVNGVLSPISGQGDGRSIGRREESHPWEY